MTTETTMERRDVRYRVDGIVDDYMERGESSTENANMGWGPNGLLMATGGEGLKRDNLERLRRAGFGELAALHKRGCVHIHDLSLGVNTPYCVGLSLENLISDGIPGKAGAAASGPAHHINIMLGQMVNVIGMVANEVAGAVAFNNVDLYLAPYAYKAYLDYKADGVSNPTAYKLARKKVRKAVRSFIWNMNNTNRWGGQTPFSNITLALSVPDDMKDRPAMVGEKPIADHYDKMSSGIEVKRTTYGDMYPWQRLVADAFLDTFIGGDYEGNMFTFPVLTVNLTKDLFEDEIRHKVWQLTAKFGNPQFQNFLNGVTSVDKKLDPADVRSMCCRLSLDLDELKSHTGGLFGNSDATGSLQNITMSLPFLAMWVRERWERKEFGDRELTQAFKMELSRVIGLIRDEQIWKRKVVEERFDQGFYKMVRCNLPRGFKTFFTTIGFMGLFECVQALTGDDAGFLSEEGMQLAEEIELHMTKEVDRTKKDTGALFNLEATPGESAAIKLARKALKEFPEVPHRGLKSRPYFTNSCHLPAELQDQTDLVFLTQSRLQTIPSGGTVTHFYVGEDLRPDEVEAVVRSICETPIPFFSLSVIFSMCIKHGRIVGYHEYCPLCTEADAKEIAKTHPELIVGKE